MYAQKHPNDNTPLHVLVHQSEEGYVAQCIEHDIAVEGATIEDAKRAFGHAVIRHVLAARQFNRELFADVPPPPAEVKAAWERAIRAGAVAEPFEIPAFTIQRRDDGGELMTEAPRHAELLCA